MSRDQGEREKQSTLVDLNVVGIQDLNKGDTPELV